MSGIIYESETGEGLGRFMIDLGDGRNMTVNVTSEGIIMDVYERQPEGGDYDLLNTSDEDVHLGTAGMMFDEWADWVEDTSRWNLPDTDCQHCGERIHIKGVYVDGTGGDVCCADKFTENNENGSHRP
jgi:hypothetical protein